MYADVTGGELSALNTYHHMLLTLCLFVALTIDLAASVAVAINALEWITGSISFLSNWTNVITGGLVYHQVQLTTHVPFAEFRDMTRDAQLYFGMEQVCGIFLSPL